jgi:hypothetical protein
MPTPISDTLSSALRSDSTVALAALMVIASAQRDLLAWAARLVGAEPAAKIAPRPNRARRRRKHNGADRPAKAKRSRADLAYHQRRREARDRNDQALLEAVRDSPEGSIGDWAAAVGKGRSSTVSALERLRDAGLAESVQGKWRAVEPGAPMAPPSKWVVPVRGTDRAQQHHLT